MPVVCITGNAAIPHDAQVALIAKVTELVSNECRVPARHVHTLILAGATFAFGGDLQRPGIYVTVKSSAQQITSESRRSLVEGLVPALQAAIPGLDGARVTTMFEELPVECIAVGTHIATFGMPSRPSLGGVPSASSAVSPRGV